MSDTPEGERDPRPVSAGQPGAGAGVGTGAGAGAGGRGAAARTREPGRPAARAEAAGQTEGTGRPAARHRIGIRELRQHASVYVDLAEKGYTVDITNRGRLVAQLIPVREPGSPLERLIAAGIIEPAEETGGVGDLEPYPSPATRPEG
jgi:prevent-host-death family protein